MKERGDFFLSINIYLTERLQKDLEAEYRVQQEQMEFDPITNLVARTKFGRPDFDTIFDELKEAHRGESMLFFFSFLFLTIKQSWACSSVALGFSQRTCERSLLPRVPRARRTEQSSFSTKRTSKSQNVISLHSSRITPKRTLSAS